MIANYTTLIPLSKNVRGGDNVNGNDDLFIRLIINIIIILIWFNVCLHWMYGLGEFFLNDF